MKALRSNTKLEHSNSMITYNVGDLVEISHQSGTKQARLSEMLGTASHPRWQVELTTGGGALTTVDQDDIGKVIDSSVASDNDSINLISGSDGDDEPLKAKATKRVSFSDDSKTGPPTSTSRFGPTRRRKNRPAKRSAPKSKAARGRRKGGKTGKRTPPSNEPVTKIPMNTGTLYMYGGPNRRAEFVPHV